MNNIKNLLITKSYTPKDVYEKINFKFDKKFDYTKIRNAYYKVKASLFGTPNNEAHELIKLLESLKNLGFIHFAAKAHPQNKNLEALVFASEGMISLYRSYKDILILDTASDLNRFNMPVLTLAGANNNEATVIFGFAFLQDENSLLKEWVFDNFKKKFRKKRLTLQSQMGVPLGRVTRRADSLPEKFSLPDFLPEK